MSAAPRVNYRTCMALFASVLGLLAAAGCGRKDADAPHIRTEHAHVHHAPHGGTVVALGQEAFHVELVRDPSNGKIRAYILDGEMENFIRIAAPRFDIVARVDGGAAKVLEFIAVNDPATGETPGDASCFETSAEWIKHADSFHGIIPALTIRGVHYAQVEFSFPEGNESAPVHSH